MKATIALFLLLLLVAASPRQSPPTIDAAYRLFTEGKLSEAGKIYESLLAKDPRNVDLHIGLIRTRLETNDLEAAMKAAKTALTALPLSARVAVAVGDVEYRLARFSEATLLYSRATQLEPGLARGWWGLGRIHAVTSLRKKAREYFEKAYQLDPADADIVRDWAYTRPTPEGIASGLEAALKARPLWTPERVKVVRNQIVGNRYLGNRDECRASAAPPFEIKLEEDNTSSPVRPLAGRIGVKVSVNGVEPRPFVLSSTSNVITMTSNLAKKANVTKLVDTTEGSLKSYLGFLDRLRVGALEFRNCLVEVIESTPPPGIDLDGRIGIELFSDYRVQLDLRKKRMLSLTPLPSLPQGEDRRWQDHTIDTPQQDNLRVYRVGSQLLVETRLDGGEPGFYSIAVEDVYTLLAPYWADKSLRNGHYVNVRFGQFSETAYAWTWGPSSSSFNFSVGTEVSGRLGHDVLTRFILTFDLRNGLVKFEK